MAEIKNISTRHSAIAEWLIANPEQDLKACALAFGITQSWLSTVIHSDIFQAYYQKLLGDYHDDRILPLRDKLVGVAHSAADKLIEKLPFMESPQDLNTTLSNVTRALGMGANKTSVNIKNTGGMQIQQLTVLTSEEMAEARAIYDESCKRLGMKPATIEGEAVEVSDAPSSA